MEQFLQTAALAVIVLFVIFVAVLLVRELCSKEHLQKICVVRKRKTTRRGNSNTGWYTHYTIDCTFSDSDKLHTFDCNASVFESLKEGKTYTVSVKALHITAIPKPKKKEKFQ